MWWGGCRRASVYLGQRTAAWDVEGGPVRCVEVGSALEGLAQIEKALRERGRLKVRVLLGARLAPPFLMEPALGVRRWKEALQVAEALAPELTGLAGPCSVWLGDTDPAQPLVGAAVERTLLAAVRRSLHAQGGVELVSLRPWWSCVLQECVAKSGHSAQILRVDEPETLTLLAGAGNAIAHAAAYWPMPEGAQAEGLIARASLNTGVTATGGAYVVWEAQQGFPGRWGRMS